MTTITGTVTSGITLGQAGYTSPLRIKHSGTVSNSGGAAVYASGTYTNPSIVNQGSVIAAGVFDAIELKDGGNVANNGKDALIQGYTGIDISGGAGAVTNSGTIAATGTYGGGVLLEGGGSVQNSGLIQGGPAVVFYFQGQYQTYKFHVGGAVFVGGSTGTVLNSGTIVGTGYGSGVFLAAGGRVENSGSIQGGVDISGFPFSGGPGTVTNSGTIAGGVYLGAGGSVANTGLIESVFAGVQVAGAGMVTNTGTILSTSTYRGGVELFGGSLGNTGLIQGGFGVTGAAAITNSGTIVGTAAFMGGVDFERAGRSSVSNTGLIQGQGAGGVYISYFGGAAGTVTNSGTIEGSGGPSFSLQQRHNGGVFLGDGGSIGNSGLIQGYNGIAILSFTFNGVYSGGVGTVTNSGTIVGTGTGAHGGGVIFGTAVVGSGGGVIVGSAGTVVDSGTITGGNGVAISFGETGGNLLTLEHGYNLGGSVVVAGTGNTLELLGAAGAVTVDFDKPGAGFNNFDTVAFGADSNHTETLAITNSAVVPGEISGFTQRHEIVDLTQLAPKNATATLNASDQLVVANGSQSVSLQLDPSEDYSGVVWLARPDGSGGTNVAVIHPGDPAPQASNTSFFSAAAAGATIGSTPVSQYKGGASMSGLFDASTPFEHFILAHGHGPPFG